MRCIKLIFIISIVGFLIVNCVPATFETASIKKGVQYSLGCGVNSFSFSAYDAGLYAIGIFGDASIRKGWTDWLEGSARLSLGGGIDDYDYRFIPYIDGGLGIKVAASTETIKPALRADFGFYNADPTFSATFLLGIKPIEQNEILTLGARSYLYRLNEVNFPYTDVFTTVHFPKNISLFVGTNIQILVDEIRRRQLPYPWNPTPIFTVGVGWKFDKIRKGKE